MALLELVRCLDNAFSFFNINWRIDNDGMLMMVSFTPPTLLGNASRNSLEVQLLAIPPRMGL
jgi:hypothetical protein